MTFTPKKLYYKIGEVCGIVGVEPHVLRYWESEFARLSPPKNKAGQRIYRPKDIALLLQIRKLLYEDGFTIAGARKRLLAAVPETHVPAPPPAPSKPRSSAEQGSEKKSERLSRLRQELENILTLLGSE